MNGDLAIGLTYAAISIAVLFVGAYLLWMAIEMLMTAFWK